MSFDLRPRKRAGALHSPFALRAEVPFSRKGLCSLQHDFDVANGSGATVRADFNNAIEALATLSSGATEPGTTYPYQLWADTTAGLLKQRNAANGAWEVRGTLAETLGVSRSSDTILAAADYIKFFVATATFTQTLTAAATLGDGWSCYYRVNAGATVTFDPNSTEQIDGAATKVVVGPASGMIFCDGSGFRTYGFDFPLASQAEMEAGSSVAVAVTPGRQHFHPSAAKAWCRATVTGTISSSYNVTSVTDNGTGDITVTWATDFADANYAVIASPINNYGGGASTTVVGDVGPAASLVAGSVRAQSVRVSDGVATDPVSWSVIAFGDHA